MKQIDTYITEKLHLKKGMKSDISILEKYNVGDICLLFIHHDDKHGIIYNTMDAVEITKIQDQKFTLELLTKTSEKNKSIVSRPFAADEEHPYKYLYYQKSKNVEMILIPTGDAIKILESMIPNDNKIDWYSILFEDKYSHIETVAEIQILTDGTTYTRNIRDKILKQIIDKFN